MNRPLVIDGGVVRELPFGQDFVVAINNFPLDVFSNLVTGERDNQIEVHFDDVNYANYLTHTMSGGGSGGTRTQLNGHVRYSTGTSATGRAQAVSLDVVKYRPVHEVYAAWSAAFLVAGVANSWQRIGLFDANNGVFMGYEGTTLGVTYRTAGVDTFVARSAWDDPCDGSAGSLFTRDGLPEALDPTKLNVWRVRLGWLGAAGFILEVISPDLNWVPVYTFKRLNASDTPYIYNPDLPLSVDVGKTSGATVLTIATACAAGGTTSAKARLTDPITDRSLVENTRAVITGKTTGGGGGYVDVKVNPSGALAAEVTATDLDIRDLSLLLDSVRQTLRVSTPLSQAVTGPVTDQVLISMTAGQRLRLIRNAGHVDPALDTATYPLVTIKLGATTIYRDKLEAGLPWSETVCFEGASDEDLTISIDVAATIYLNLRYEVFA